MMRHFSVDALYVFHEAMPLHASQERFKRASKSGRRAGRGAGDSGGGTSGAEGGGVGGASYKEGVGLKRVNRPPVNRLRLDVPELSSDLDSHQVTPQCSVVVGYLLRCIQACSVPLLPNDDPSSRQVHRK